MLLGAHVSTSGGLEKAPGRGREIGCDAIQIFTRNQRTWSAKPLEKKEIRDFREAREKEGIRKVVSHASYLVNAAAPDPENLKKSRALLAAEVDRCVKLGLEALVLHPGARIEDPMEKALKRVAASLRPLLDKAEKGGLKILLENTAGQGSTLGADFDELGEILDLLVGHPALGVCFDTAHAWGAGYDLRGKGLEKTLKDLESRVGKGRLHCLHLNDTNVPLGSRKDRHAPIGEGLLGLPLFRKLHNSRALASLPGILETPNGMEGWEKELKLIRGKKR